MTRRQWQCRSGLQRGGQGCKHSWHAAITLQHALQSAACGLGSAHVAAAPPTLAWSPGARAAAGAAAGRAGMEPAAAQGEAALAAAA